MPAPYATAAELCVARDVVVSARSHAWVPVDVACLAPGVDYTVFPRLTVDASETVQLAGPVAITGRSASQVLLTNVGTTDAVLARRTPVADALVARLGDAQVQTARTFELSSVYPVGAGVHLADAMPASSADVDVSPLDICEEAASSVPPAVPAEPTTVMVDETFRVGVAATGEPHAEIVAVLRRHRAAFALDGRPGRVVGHEMPIDLRVDAALHPEAPRRASPEKCRAMDSAIDQLLSWDVIEPSSSPVSFPVLMIRQYDKWRFCIDYRQVNAQTIPDSYPLPTTDSVFNSLTGKRIFSSLDALRGYHQLGVREQDRWKTAFTCHRGLFQYKTIPFGLRNAPAVFQRLMDALLGELRWRDAVVYIDDVVVATHTMAEHVVALETLLARMASAGLRFSPAKCTFAVSSLVLLGRKVSGAGVAVWGDRAKAVLDLPRPRTLRDLYHVLGLFGYYRAFVPRFATVAAPLSQLTQGPGLAANPVERTIQTAKFVLQSLCVTSKAHWDRRAVPAAELAINSTPSVTTGERPFDLIFVAHPDLVHAVFDSEEHSGVGSFAERLAAADARLAEARESVSVARAAQKRNYDRSHAALPILERGARVFVRLDDRPMPGASRDKLSSRKQGPYEVIEVLSPHRVRLALPAGIGIGDEFDVSQLDVEPALPDPFAAHRVASPPADPSSPAPGSPELPPVTSPALLPRVRRPPPELREYELGPTAFPLTAVPLEALRGPYRRPRHLQLDDGREVVLEERPVAFLSRLTAPAERKLVAAELELCCLAWSFGRFLHLLEGAEVTVVTDHAPLGAMLTSSAGAKYGPVISRCRALLLPHLSNLRAPGSDSAQHGRVL
ncbi:hypothetical protein CF335_g7288 [Tilletia laevis]|nr:hypothetical protein CF335_g7288 [Tilletia laevis]